MALKAVLVIIVMSATYAILIMKDIIDGQHQKLTQRELQLVAMKGVNLHYRTRDHAKLCVWAEQNPPGDIAAALRAETHGGWLECIGRFSRQTRGKESLLFHRESGKTVSLYAIMARICRTSHITVSPSLHWIGGICALRYTHESAKPSAMWYI